MAGVEGAIGVGPKLRQGLGGWTMGIIMPVTLQAKQLGKPVMGEVIMPGTHFGLSGPPWQEW